jgi:hypothetical protein
MGSPAGLRGERPQDLQHRTSRHRIFDENWNLQKQRALFVQKTAQNDPMIYGYARGSTDSQSVEAHCASFAPPMPGRCPGLVLLVSPSLRQSRELFAKVIGFLKELEPVERLDEDNKSSCTLANGARIVSLPGDPDPVRGFSAPRLIIKDEAAYISDAMQAAIEPMLAVSEGRLIEMSSPNGRRGHFYENWQHGEGVERIKIVGRQCPRIGAEFLDQQRRKLGPLLFAQEYEGEFIDAQSSAFSSELIERALVDDFARFPP